MSETSQTERYSVTVTLSRTYLNGERRAHAVAVAFTFVVFLASQISRTTSHALRDSMADTEMDVDPPATSTGKAVDKGDAKKRFEVKKVRALSLDSRRHLFTDHHGSSVSRGALVERCLPLGLGCVQNLKHRSCVAC